MTAAPVAGNPARPVPAADRSGDGLGWQLWTAQGPDGDIALSRDGDHVEVLLSERPHRAADAARRRWSGTRLTLGLDGVCHAENEGAPSLLLIRHTDGSASVVASGTGPDAGAVEVRTQLGDVIFAASADFFDSVPPQVVAGIPGRVRRRRGLATLAQDLARKAGRRTSGQAAAVLVAQRVWPGTVQA